MLTIDEINKLQKENVELKAENEILKFQIKDLQIRKDRYYLKGLEQERQISDCITLLQKIKKYIAKICKEECGYVQKKRCPDCDCRYGAILDLITKAESEG